MKKLFFIIAFFLAMQANSQNITFTGSGLTTIKVENMTKGVSLTLGAGDVLTLSITTGIQEIKNMNSSIVKIYPNPMTDNSILEIFPPEAGNATLSVYDMSGKIINRLKTFLGNYPQEFRLSGFKKGVYLINVKGNSYQCSGRLLSNGRSNTTAKIEKVNKEIKTADGKTPEMDIKGVQDTPSILYTHGDYLKFTGTSGSNTTIITTGSIINDTLITFAFYPCSDGDGNNYPIVQIGTQIWMGENLKTTKYNDNTDIPLVTGDLDWEALTTPAYCWYNNDSPSYKETYGALYNFFAVNTGKICATGWHVPTDTEWSALTTYLGGEGVASGKLKETGTVHWTSPNTGATNETGFTSLPGGARNLDGTFDFIGGDGHWWSSSEYDVSNSWIRYMSNNYGGVSRINIDNVYGLSVRCVRDTLIETEAAINDSLQICYSKLYDYIELAYLFDAVYSNHILAPNSSWTEIYDHTQTFASDNVKIFMLWSKAYDIIFRINLIIKSSGIVLSDPLISEKIIAQAKAIRAYLYYNTMTWFGEVPLEPGTYESMIPRNTVEEVLVQIKQDATEASLSLPVNWALTDQFRVTQNFAKGLLARASLYNKNYNEALNPAQQIINSGMYALTADTSNFTASNTEILWGIEKRTNTEFNAFFNKGSFVPVIRYSELLLIAAEALFNTGNTSAALSYINALNARRGKPNAASLTNDAIFQHWNTQLVKEGSMFISLKRFDKALNVVQNYPHKLLLPVPLYYINRNPYLTQNVGY
jgi:uncharacterized protein (TIGR02145 family)